MGRNPVKLSDRIKRGILKSEFLTVLKCHLVSANRNRQTTEFLRSSRPLVAGTQKQHAHSYFCLGVHVPPGVSIWGYMFIFEGTHILELFFHSKRIEAMKSDHLDVYNSDIIML